MDIRMDIALKTSFAITSSVTFAIWSMCKPLNVYVGPFRKRVLYFPRFGEGANIIHNMENGMIPQTLLNSKKSGNK